MTIPERKPLIRALHVLTLGGFAIAQPLYDLLARNPDFFIVRQSSIATVAGLVLALSFAVPGLAALVQALAWAIHRGAGAATDLVLVFTLTGATLLPPLNRLQLGAWMAVGVAAAAGAAFAAAYVRTRAAGWFLTFLSPSILLFPLAFLLFSPVLKTTAKTGAIPDMPAPRLEGPMVMVVFDELPLVSLLDENHRIDAVRFPNFARLAATATWHPDARSLSGSTAHSVGMLLTGQYTDYYDLPLFSVYPRNLFTLLAGAGPVSAVESATRFCPPALCDRAARSTGNSVQRGAALLNDLGVVYLHLLLPERWRGRLPPIGDNWLHFVLRGQESQSYDERPQIFSRFVRNIPARPAGFHFIHTFLPHVPWAYLPDGRTYSLQPWVVPGLNLNPDSWARRPWVVAQGWRRHLWQTQLADRLLGELLDHLQAIGAFESSLIVVTADHGCNFVPGEARRASLPGRETDTFGIPLLIKSPGQTSAVVDTALIRTTDVLDELAQILGMTEAWDRPPADRGPQRPWPRPEWRGHESMREKIQLFGSGARALPKTGPRLDLLGQVPAHAQGLSADTLEFVLDDPSLFRRVAPDSPFIPLLVRGQVKGRDQDALQLAIAVNGVIRAVTETYRKDGRWFAFSALLDPEDLRAGENRIEVHALE